MTIYQYALIYLALGCIYLGIAYHLKGEKHLANAIAIAPEHSAVIRVIFLASTMIMILPAWPIYLITGLVVSLFKGKRGNK